MQIILTRWNFTLALEGLNDPGRAADPNPTRWKLIATSIRLLRREQRIKRERETAQSSLVVSLVIAYHGCQRGRQRRQCLLGTRAMLTKAQSTRD